MLTIYMRLGSYNLVEEQQMQTSMDLLGQLWAFFGLVCSVLAIYFLRYNEERFYQNNPGWDGVDALFRSRYDRELKEGDHNMEHLVISPSTEENEEKTIQVN